MSTNSHIVYTTLQWNAVHMKTYIPDDGALLIEVCSENTIKLNWEMVNAHFTNYHMYQTLQHISQIFKPKRCVMRSMLTFNMLKVN